MTGFKDRMDYIRSLFAPETAAQAAARASLTAAHDQISLDPEEGRLLQVLLRLIDARKVVEIGTLGGCSALWMADALPDGGHIYTIEKDPARAALARSNLAGHGKITLAEGDAADILPRLEVHGPFDAVFIDADKISYTAYLDWTEKHLRRGGLVIGDNTFLFDAVWMDDLPPRVRETARANMRAFNARLADAEKYNGIMLPTAAGMTIAQKLF